MKHLKSTFTFGENLKIRTPPLFYQKVPILNCGLFDFFTSPQKMVCKGCCGSLRDYTGVWTLDTLYVLTEEKMKKHFF